MTDILLAANEKDEPLAQEEEEEEEELNFDQTLAYCPQWSRGPSTLHYCTTRDLQLQRRPWNQHLNVDQLGSSIPLP